MGHPIIIFSYITPKKEKKMLKRMKKKERITSFQDLVFTHTWIHPYFHCTNLLPFLFLKGKKTQLRNMLIRLSRLFLVWILDECWNPLNDIFIFFYFRQVCYFVGSFFICSSRQTIGHPSQPIVNTHLGERKNRTTNITNVLSSYVSNIEANKYIYFILLLLLE